MNSSSSRCTSVISSSSSRKRAPEARRDLVHVGRADPVDLATPARPSKTTSSTTRRCASLSRASTRSTASATTTTPVRRAPRPRRRPSGTVAGRGRRWKSAIRRAVIVRSQTWNSPSEDPSNADWIALTSTSDGDVLDRRRRHLQRHPPRDVVPVPVDQHRERDPRRRVPGAPRRAHVRDQRVVVEPRPARPLPAGGTRPDRIECGGCARRSRSMKSRFRPSN